VSPAAATIQIVVAVIDDGRGNVLLVRKHGATAFIQPGGKPMPGEAPLRALARELYEELGVRLVPGSAVALGEFSDLAVNEPGHRVQAQAWWVRVQGTPRAQAEIAELAWVPLRAPHGRVLAPLSETHVLPAAALLGARPATPVPAIPAHPVPLARTDFVRPLALASLLLCAAVIAWCLLQALLAWPLAASRPWQLLVAAGTEHGWPASLRWMLAHPVATSVLMGAACLPSLASSWGLYYGHRWGLLSFAWLLVLTGLGNLGVAWWLDSVMAGLLLKVQAPEAFHALQVQRMAFSATLFGSCLLLAGLQGWLAWRLLRPDIQARFPPR